MHAATADEELSIPKSIVTSRIAQWRLLAGLLQGLILYFLYWSVKNAAWPAAYPYVFVSMVMVFMFVPVLLVSGLGHFEKRRLLIWIGIAAAICIVLSAHDVWRHGLYQPGWPDSSIGSGQLIPSGWLLFFSAVGFYIAHALILAGTADRRFIASYPSYFEAAWKLAVQIKFSLLFVGILWLILWLGATLFMLIKLDFLTRLLERSWFAIPVTVFAFSTAIQVTDVRPGIVRGIRGLLLVLMSWLLPITTLIVGGFLVSLPFVGLEPLWATRHATSVLLGATAVLVLLINAAFQSGEIAKQVAGVLRIAARLACLLLLPMVLVAIYALTLRVRQYGWTADRIIVAASLLVTSCYACGYLWAALQRGAWLSRITLTNTVAAFVILVVLIALFTPIADPARLSVASQLARLENGKVSAAKFDFDYLKFDGARYGNDALQILKDKRTGADAETIRTRAELALTKKNKWNRAEDKPIVDAGTRTDNITLWPKTKSLPMAFVQQNWNAAGTDMPQCLTLQKHPCRAYMIDLNGDGKEEILLKDSGAYGRMTVFTFDAAANKWQLSADINDSARGCQEVAQAMATGNYEVVAPMYKELEIAGHRLHVTPRRKTQDKCAMPYVGSED